MNTPWQHAINQKVVINLDHQGDRHVMCAWDECDRDGYELHKVVVNDAADGYPPRYMRFVFCSERHKMYWVNSHKKYGDLPPGYKRSTI
jgi:hypothetical protein